MKSGCKIIYCYYCERYVPSGWGRTSAHKVLWLRTFFPIVLSGLAAILYVVTHRQIEMAAVIFHDVPALVKKFGLVTLVVCVYFYFVVSLFSGEVCSIYKMANYHKPEARTIQELKDIANKLRIHSITATNASKSGYVP
jgi:hypothetical protein